MEGENQTKPKSQKTLIIALGAIVAIGLISTTIYVLKFKNEQPASESVNTTTPINQPVTTETSTKPSEEQKPMTSNNIDLNTNDQGLSQATVTLETTKGNIQYKFYSKDAPITTARMVELIQSGFYNGLTFHRVVPGFVIQGGDPQGTGMGGSGQKIKAEFNSRKHVIGTVAMARAGHDVNSQDSQFYICLGSFPHLDGQYTVIGQVISGIDVVQKIAVGDKMTKVSIQ